MRGPDLLHLTMDPNEIFSSTQSASQIPENLYNYHHWLAGPYSLDGKTFYSLAHSEWYACLLNANCDQAVTNNESASLNSWTNTVNSSVSTDGGASWQLNVVNGNHEANFVTFCSHIWVVLLIGEHRCIRRAVAPAKLDRACSKLSGVVLRLRMRCSHPLSTYRRRRM